MLKAMMVALAATATAVPAAAQDVPVEVMVLGSYHMNNPGRDVHNLKADDVTTPRRQRELEQLAEALASFRPTKILIETQTPGPDFTVAEYEGFTPAMLLQNRDERVQIGYRLAHRLGHKLVYGIDEKPGEGEPDYFPYGKMMAYTQQKGEADKLAALSKPIGDYMKSFETRQANESVAQLLAAAYAPDTPISGIGGYYQFLSFGDGDAQPGADLNAGWYLRNAKIFSKLINVAEPGDRLLVLFGGGHRYWLEHFAANTPGFTLVDALPYLERAAAAE